MSRSHPTRTDARPSQPPRRRAPDPELAYRARVAAELRRRYRVPGPQAERLVARWRRLVRLRMRERRSPASTAEHVRRFALQRAVRPHPGRDERARLSTARDPLTRAEAKRRAKQLLEAAEGGDREAAQVLVDVLAYTKTPTLSEDLGLALEGRAFYTTTLMPWNAVDTARGDKVRPEDRERIVREALRRVRTSLLERRRVCRPSRRDLAQLTRDPRALRSLSSLVRRACESEITTHEALREADKILRGHGVDYTRIRTRRGPRGTAFHYVQMGDTYDATLVYDELSARFRVTSWGDMIEAWERRYGHEDEDDWVD